MKIKGYDPVKVTMEELNKLFDAKEKELGRPLEAGERVDIAEKEKKRVKEANRDRLKDQLRSAGYVYTFDFGWVKNARLGKAIKEKWVHEIGEARYAFDSTAVRQYTGYQIIRYLRGEIGGLTVYNELPKKKESVLDMFDDMENGPVKD